MRGNKKKNRRRKDQIKNRNHKCNYCLKEYISYEALFTHTKFKHPDKL